MILETGPAPFWFCNTSSAQRGKEFHSRYAAAQPFPHIVLDDFLPEQLADICVTDFPQRAASRAGYARSQENLKFEFKPESLSPSLRSLFYSFNSAPFIGFLEDLTGISGLIPDPYFGGGGLHEVANGGHLNIHADFNHHTVLNLERRINVLIYLNRDWKEEYGGSFEIWDRTMSQRCLRVTPIFNRCVVFNTSSTSFHGNPDPVNHPLGYSRRSIALYYYTATWDGSRRPHSTQFKVRPDSVDRSDVSLRVHELMTDLTPPIAMRAFNRLSNLLKRMMPAQRADNPS
jgi:Rps23 Pro-64 3,4-dihydroxylase Tpa1-like proline 4-hydroxylase